jgi:PAS domain S-box-containing protein
MASPSLQPLPMSNVRSVSPGFVLDEDGSESDISESSQKFPLRKSSAKFRKPLSISTQTSVNGRLGSPLQQQQGSADSTERPVNRSHSDGDLSEYLKGFADLKSSLQMAHLTCNTEIRKILEEMQEHIQRGLEVARSMESLKNSAEATSPLTLMSDQIPSVLDEIAKQYDMPQTSSPSLSPTRPSRLLINKDSPRLETIYSADPSQVSSLPSPVLSTSSSDLRRITHRKTKSDTLKLALELDVSTREDKVESPFMKALLEVSSIAQNILDLNLSTLMIPGTAQGIVTHIQSLLHMWKENPDWQLQDLVVRLLIVFASIARLMEHFEEDMRTWALMSNEKAMSNHMNASKSFSSRPSSRPDSAGASVKRDSIFSSIFAQEYSDIGENDEYYEDSEVSHESPPRRSLASRQSSKYKKLYRAPSSITSDSVNRWNYNAFRAAVDEEQNLNVLMELSRDGKVTYVSPAVKKVFQFTQEEVVGSSTIPFLLDPNRNTFMEAALQQTPQARTGLEVCFTARRADGRYIKVEGKGVISYDVDQQMKNIVWVMRPVKVSRGDDSPSLIPRVLETATSAIPEPIPNVDLALCNICERSVPAIHFGIHSEVCLRVHKSEMDLVLLNDEIKNQRTICEEKIGLLTEELCTVEEEIKHLEAGMETPIKYLSYLSLLRTHGENIVKTLDKLKAIKVAKLEEISEQDIQLDSLRGDYTCGSEQDFVWQPDGKTMVDDGVIALALSIYSIGRSTQEFVEQKHKLMIKLQKEALEYQDCLQAEQLLTVEIGIQTQTLGMPSHDSLNSDTKFEVKEIGGVMVKIPSLANLSKNPRESLFFTSANAAGNEGELVSSTGVLSDHSASSSVDSPVQEKMIPQKLKRMPKHNLLRIQTDSDTEDNHRRRGSLRNPRMVVGDKALEIESLASPILSSNPRRPSMMFPFGSNTNLAMSASSVNSSLPSSPSISTPSIRDYEIIKPVSKGAFGSVFLAKKKITGQYFAIKVLKKADMVAKNQVMNIKSERTILTQLDSPYVVKLFSTFQSKNHIYLVMEYLNGGDCAALLKAMGTLSEEWSRQYVSEMIAGLEFLHHRDIVHRDLKPDNMLIDSNGHIKLTDFGLSRAGFIGRRSLGVGDVGTPPKSSLPHSPTISHDGNSLGFQPSYSPFRGHLGRRESLASVSSTDSLVLGSRVAEKLEDKNQKKLVGTPDYLAPESILGLGQGTSVDWVKLTNSVGCGSYTL